MQLILLGTGTSTGVPEVGCGCATCQSADPRDKRLRSSALLVTADGTRILIDCGPDFRQQARHIGLDRIDVVLLTHEHYDHVYGLDDLRTIAWEREIPIYAQGRVLQAVRERMHYVFSPNPYPGTPRLSLVELSPEQELLLGGISIRPIVVEHGRLPIYGYRFTEEGAEGRSLVYITDMKGIAPSEWAKVKDCDLLLINALRLKKEHPSHQSILDAVARVKTLSSRPKLSVLTHLSHHAPPHRDMAGYLPEDMVAGYDYMSLELKAGRVHCEPLSPQPEPYEYHDLDRLYTSTEREALSLRDLITKTPTTAGSQLKVITSREHKMLELYLEFSRQDYPQSREVLYQAFATALARLARLYHIDQETFDLCHQKGYPNVIGDKVYLYVVCAVNHHPKSLSVLGNGGKEIDMFVLKAQLSACMHREFKALLPSPLRPEASLPTKHKSH